MRWAAIAAQKRILAQEEGVVIKDWGGRLPVALIYPNTYYVGMSSLALQTLYRLLNARRDVVCERVFQGHRRLQRGSTPLSVETQRRLPEFAVLATTFSFELDYLNFVTLLHAAGISPLSAERDEGDPLLLAGGPAISANPEPLAELCDAFVIGEAEDILPYLLDTLRDGIADSRQTLLRELSSLPGVYVPALATAEEVPQGQVQRQWVRDLDRYPTDTSVLTKATQFGDMYLIEIARGCRRRCRFCLAGCLYRPPRERSAAVLLEQARVGQQFRPKVGLVSPAVSDYSQIDDLVTGLQDMGMQVSVSSLRVDPLPEVLLSALAASGARTLTIAPEAGSERLRSAIRKGVRHQDILNAAEAASRHRFSELKLYFMVGLPGEEDEDVEAIVQLVQTIAGLFGGRIVASVAPFVPKAHTPFQREAMASASVLRERLRRLSRGLRAENVHVTAESVGWAYIQAVLARGDRHLGTVLASLQAPSLANWEQAMRRCGLEGARYTGARSPDESLPWDFIRMSEPA